MSKRKDLKNKKFRKLTAIKTVKNDDGTEKKQHGNLIWECICDCGGSINVSSNRLLMGHTSSCGCLKKPNLLGKTFNKLKVIKKVPKRINDTHSFWECECECGKISEVSGTRLVNGITKSCGCLKEINRDLSGKKVGRLSPIELCGKDNYGSRRWKCRCDCGNISKVRETSLVRGTIKSCGCIIKRDLTGKKFGKLTVIKKSKDLHGNSKKYGNFFVWLCICECGKEIEVPTGSLTSGNTKSCGCAVCSKHITQELLHKIIENIFNIEAEPNYRKFKWLKNKETGRNLEIDIYVPKIRLAVEYDGEFHFREIKFIRRSLEEIVKLDRLKNRLIKKHIRNGGKDIKYFVRFNYKENITEENVIKKLKKHGII